MDRRDYNDLQQVGRANLKKKSLEMAKLYHEVKITTENRAK